MPLSIVVPPLCSVEKKSNFREIASPLLNELAKYHRFPQTTHAKKQKKQDDDILELRRPTVTGTSWRADEIDETRCAKKDTLDAVVVVLA